VLDRLPRPGADTLAGPGSGLDCAVVRSGEERIVLTCDPVTGASADIGRIAVHVSCNDIASAGLRPRFLLMSLVAPPGTDADAIAALVDQAAEAARTLGVEIVGGHTEISDAVTRFVVNTTAIGFAQGRPLVTASGARDGDALLMTRTAGIEGTAILAADRSGVLASVLSPAELDEARRFIDSISVVRDGEICGREGATAMHDATEGGILGAVWELAEASGLGCLVEAGAIPVHPMTRRVAAAFSLDPLRLISSGSMIVATGDPDPMVAALAAAGIEATVIGRMTAGPERVLSGPDCRTPLLPPGPDELYSAIGSNAPPQESTRRTPWHTTT
jgi:hydrogenase expression/formation protein HypE